MTQQAPLGGPFDNRTYQVPMATVTGLTHDEFNAAVKEAARREERDRLADLIEESAEIIAGFASTKENTVRLIATLIRLNDGS